MSSGKYIDCEIIRDLLPLYCENLVSDKTGAAVKKHLADCSDCKELCTSMQRELAEKPVPESLKKEIQPFKKIRRKGQLKIVVSFLLALMLAAGAFCVFYVGVVPMKAENLNVKYTATYTAAEENGGKEIWQVDFSFENLSGRSLVMHSAEKPGIRELTAYSVFRLPFDDLGGSMSYGFASEKPFSEDDVVTVRCRDRELVYSLKEIAEECGLNTQSEKTSETSGYR